MNYRKKFLVAPGSRIRLKDFDPQFTDNHEDKHSALTKITKLQQRMDELQYRLYAEQKRSLLICLQAPDAGGKNGVVRHVDITVIGSKGVLFEKEKGARQETY